jgi:membrane protease YdiL (CAAX protease family)
MADASSSAVKTGSRFWPLAGFCLAHQFIHHIGGIHMSSNEQSGSRFNSFLANYPPIAIAITAVGYIAFSFLEIIPLEKVISALLLFFSLGFAALVLMPFVLGLPNGRKSLREYCLDIRLLPLQPVGRNLLLGLSLAVLTLGAILLSALATGHFVFDWSLVPGVRWIKGLTRGIWEEVFFRGIILVLFMRYYPTKKKTAIFYSTFVFAILHLGKIDLEAAVDVVSVFFIGLLFTYVVLKTGSLLPAIVFHYVHDIFINLVQNAPGADRLTASVMLYGFLWTSLVLGGLLTKWLVERWPSKPDGQTTVGG